MAHQRSHIGEMATIALIVIGDISLLVKWNNLTREVFCWLAAGREHLMFFSRQKARNERWEVVADRHLKLLPISILDIKEIEHIDMLSTSIQ